MPGSLATAQCTRSVSVGSTGVARVHSITRFRCGSPLAIPCANVKLGSLSRAKAEGITPSAPNAAISSRRLRFMTRLQFLEIASDREQAEAGPRVRSARRSVPRVTAGLDHRDRHARFLHALDGEVRHRERHAASLEIRIDGDHVDLAELVRRVIAERDETRDCVGLECDPDLEVCRSAYVTHGLLLRPAPALRVERVVDSRREHLLERIEDRRPRTQREARDTVDMTWVAGLDDHPQTSLNSRAKFAPRIFSTRFGAQPRSVRSLASVKKRRASLYSGTRLNTSAASPGAAIPALARSS